MKEQTEKVDLNRRNFLKGGSMASVGRDSKRQGCLAAPPRSPGRLPPMRGLRQIRGHWMRISWSRHRGHTGGATQCPWSRCVIVRAFLRRTGRSAPDAKQYANYKDLLADENVEAVVIATPSHQHKEIVQNALKAGKHVYCEAPLASTIEDAKAIAMAAHQHPKQYFQAGLQFRSDPQRDFLVDYVRTGAWGQTVSARSQWHKKTSWKRAAPTNEREKEINWRLDKNHLRIDQESVSIS